MATKKDIFKTAILLLDHKEDFDFLDTGEINLTRFTEEIAHEMDHDEWLDDELHPVWEVAMEAADT